MVDDIIFLQNSCFMAYMEKHKLDNVSAAQVFQAYNLFGYIREHFEYLHLIGQLSAPQPQVVINNSNNNVNTNQNANPAAGLPGLRLKNKWVPFYSSIRSF